MKPFSSSKNITFFDLVKSKLFFPPTLHLIQNSAYVIFLSFGLYLLLPVTESQMELLIYWSAIILLTQIPLFIYLSILIKRNFILKLDFSSMSKYLLVSVGIFGITYILSERFLEYTNNIFEFLPNFLFFVVLGIGGYLGITYIVDSRTRKLFHAVIQEIKNKKS